jgi:hypothetical protein
VPGNAEHREIDHVAVDVVVERVPSHFLMGFEDGGDHDPVGGERARRQRLQGSGR